MDATRNVNKHDDLIYDIGMHMGEDTDYYLKKGFRVIGFEANPELVRMCNERFANQIKCGRLIIVEGAIVDRRADDDLDAVEFYRNRGLSVWGTVVEAWATRNARAGHSSDVIEVRAVDFTESLARHGIPRYMKIDIEGMDTVCIKALSHFEQRPDFVSMEASEMWFDKLMNDLMLLRELGYSGFKVIQQSGISRQKEPNPSREQRYVGYKFQEGSSGLFGHDLPGRWNDYEQLCKIYRTIFFQIRLFGEQGVITRFWGGRMLRRALSIGLRTQIPGWYDTHAKHSSVRTE